MTDYNELAIAIKNAGIERVTVVNGDRLVIHLPASTPLEQARRTCEAVKPWADGLRILIAQGDISVTAAEPAFAEKQ